MARTHTHTNKPTNKHHINKVYCMWIVIAFECANHVKSSRYWKKFRYQLNQKKKKQNEWKTWVLVWAICSLTFEDDRWLKHSEYLNITHPPENHYTRACMENIYLELLRAVIVSDFTHPIHLWSIILFRWFWSIYDGARNKNGS